MDKTTLSITLNGEINSDNASWIQWYYDSKAIIKLIGYEPTHVGISGTLFNSGKVLSISKSEKKVIRSLENGDNVNYISLFSLPKEYRSATFDFNILLARDEGYITLIMNKSDFNPVQEEELISILKKYIYVKGGEVYEMDREEVPLLYAAKDNPQNAFKTLNVLKVID